MFRICTNIFRQPVNSIKQFSTCSYYHSPWINLSPRICLHDVPTKITGGELTPDSDVTVRASLLDEKGKLFISQAYYRSNNDGNLDLDKDSSIGGSYHGVFPSGLLTTLKPAPTEFKYLRLYRRDPTTPWKIKISLHKGHISLEENSKSIVEDEMTRYLTSPGVKRIQIKSGRVHGALYLPPGPGPHPGVIDMFGTAGGLMEFRSALLASRGIASMALAYFAYEDLPKSLKEFDLEYFEEAVETLISQKNIIPDRCGVVAVSKAADFAILMGIYLEKVKAIVTIGGSPVASSLIRYKNKILAKEFPLPLENMKIDEEGRFHPDLEKFVKQISTVKSALLPIEQTPLDKKYLIVAGDEDAWGCNLGMQYILGSMKDENIKRNIHHIEYKKVGHILEPPYGSLIYDSYMRFLPVENPDGSQIGGIPLLWGGQAYETCKAQEHFWPILQNFLNHNVRDKSEFYQKFLAC